jgi:hypothetical protein
MRVLDLIDPAVEEEDILVNYQLASNYIVQNLEKALQTTRDPKTRETL